MTTCKDDSHAIDRLALRAHAYLRTGCFRLRFDAELECAYRRDILRSQIDHLLIFYGAGIFIYLFYLVVDFHLLGENFLQSVYIRSVLLCAALVLIPWFYANRARIPLHLPERLTFIAALYSSMSVLYIQNLATPDHLPLYSSGTMIVMLFYNIVILQGFYYALTCSLITLIVVFINRIQVVGADDPHTLLALADHLVVTVLSLTARYLIDRKHRINYAQKFLLQRRSVDLEKLAITDFLTGVFNRRYFDQQFELICQRSRAADQALSLLFIDIDQFKRYNDHLGHRQGDQCIIHVAEAIRDSLRGDLVARYGGEEFVVLLRDNDHLGAIRVVRRIQERLADIAIPHPSSDVSDSVTISIGVADTKMLTPGSDFASLIEFADTALYAAKSQGRNRYCLYHTGLESKLSSFTLERS